MRICNKPRFQGKCRVYPIFYGCRTEKKKKNGQDQISARQILDDLSQRVIDLIKSGLVIESVFWLESLNPCRQTYFLVLKLN